MLFNLSEVDAKDKTYVELILEDVFGLNNPLLQTQENLIKSNVLLEKRKKMVNEFKSIMFTSLDKKSMINEQKKVSNKKQT